MTQPLFSRLRFGWLLTSLLLVFACSSPPQISKSVLMPAKIHALKNMQNISISELQGDNNGYYGGRVEHTIAAIEVDNQAYFNLVERTQLEAILSEQKLSESGLLSQLGALQAGQLAEIDTLITGSVLTPAMQRNQRFETRTNYDYCLEYRKTSSTQQSCVNYASYRVLCYDVSTRFSLNLRFIDVQTAAILHAGSYTGNASQSYCDDQSSISNHALEQIAVTRALTKLHQDIAPYATIIALTFLDADDGSQLKNLDKPNQQFEQALEIIDNGNLVKGCNQFKQIASQYNQSPAVYYNLGICAETQAAWSKANQYFKTAQNLISSEALPQINQAIKRTDQRLQQQQTLQQQKQSRQAQ